VNDEILNKYEQSKQELRELVRDAHGAIKDMRKLLKEFEDYRKEAEVALQKQVDEHVGPLLEENLNHLTVQFKKFCDQSEERIYARFDQLGDILMGEDKQSKKKGERSLSQIAEDIATLREGKRAT
jgi:Sec-independent protein translocase protein TatA